MNYSDYDELFKYYLEQKRKESIYKGNPNIYQDGRKLEIFPSGKDEVNNQNPKFVFGTVIYLHYKDKVLILKQEKEERVVDTLVGLGGKVAAKINNIPEENEKADLSKIINSYKMDSLDTTENMKLAAAREVMEETSTYSKDTQGRYTHDIIKEGLTINSQKLAPIGLSRIRIINHNKTESWLIQNYKYDLSEEEYQYIEKEVSKTNREGSLEWMTLEEALPRMSSSDSVILQMKNPKISVTEIRDNVNNHNILRVSFDNQKYFVTYIDGNPVIDTFNSDNKFIKLKLNTRR